jgi:hypothetical protein
MSRNPPAYAVLVAVALVIAAAQSVGAEPTGRTARVPRGIDVHYVGHEAGEPTLGVDRQGRVFYAAADMDLQGLPQIDVMRGTDNGSTWEIVSPGAAGNNAHVVTGDPYVYVDNTKDGARVFTVDLQGYNCSLLSFSDDAGESWLTNPLACGQPVGDHQTLFSAPPVTSATIGYPNLLYYCFQDVVSSKCTKSLDGGLSFLLVGGLSFEGFDVAGNLCGGLHGHGYGGADGTIYIPKVHCGEPWLAISKDEGTTWQRVRVTRMPAIGHEASVAADRSGNIYYAYIGRDMLPYLVTSRDGGKSWGSPLRMSRPGITETSLPSLDVGNEGNVVVGFMGSSNADGRDTLGEKPEAVWNGYLTYTHDGLAPRPTLRYLQVNPESDPLLRGACPQIKCGPEFDFIDVVVAPDGSIWSAFVDGCTALCRTEVTISDAADGIAVHVRNVDLRR